MALKTFSQSARYMLYSNLISYMLYSKHFRTEFFIFRYYHETVESISALSLPYDSDDGKEGGEGRFPCLTMRPSGERFPLLRVV